MSATSRAELENSFELSLSRACRALECAAGRALIMGYEGAEEDLAGMYAHVVRILEESTRCSAGGRRRLRKVGP